MKKMSKIPFKPCNPTDWIQVNIVFLILDIAKFAPVSYKAHRQDPHTDGTCGVWNDKVPTVPLWLDHPENMLNQWEHAC